VWWCWYGFESWLLLFLILLHIFHITGEGGWYFQIVQGNFPFPTIPSSTSLWCHHHRAKQRNVVRGKEQTAFRNRCVRIMFHFVLL
jgi:hypothetical protein